MKWAGRVGYVTGVGYELKTLLENLKEGDHPSDRVHVLCTEFVVGWLTARGWENTGRRAKLCPDICLEMNRVKPRNTSISITNIWNEIQTEHLPNKNLAQSCPNFFGKGLRPLL